MTSLWINGVEVEGVKVVGWDLAAPGGDSTVYYTGLKDISGSFSGKLEPAGLLMFPEFRALAERWAFILRNRARRRPQRSLMPKHHPHRRHGR